MKLLNLLSLIFVLSLSVFKNSCIDCSECCKQGRRVSTQCALECNNCMLINDEARAEADDFPS